MSNRSNPPVAAPKMSSDALERLDIAYDRLREERAEEFFSTEESTTCAPEGSSN